MQHLASEKAFYADLFGRKPDNEHITAGYDELYALAFKEPPKGLVFDIGCGTGAHAVRLARRGYDVMAMDLTIEGVKSARERFAKEGLKGRFLVGDAEQLPVRDGTADVAWTSLLLHHFPKLDKLPPELARITRSRVIAFEPNAQNLLTWFAFNVANRWFWWTLKKMVRNQRAIWPGRLVRLFRRYGFEAGEVYYIDRQWSDRLGVLRRMYLGATSWLPLSYRANKFLVTFRKVAA
jgi:ubiquinone/menaquinone biosynthesis C-methylase UbiE